MPITVIDSSNANDFLEAIVKAGYFRGLKKRDYRASPPGYQSAVPLYPDSMLIPPAQQQAMLDKQIASQSSGYDLRTLYYPTLKSLDQDSLGLCWAFSSTKADMYARVRMGLPDIILSPWYVAGKVKNWRDEGGSGDESAGFLAQYGAPSMDQCPAYKRTYDTPAVAENALMHQVTQWWDGTDSREKNLQIMLSSCLLGLDAVGDLNWLGHSMKICRVVSINPLVVDYDNSWNAIDQYGENGLYRLSGAHAIPDNICVVGKSMATMT